MAGFLGAVAGAVVLLIAFKAAFWARDNKGIRRDAVDNVLGGVCGGLAHYFDIAPWLVRVLAVIALFSTGGYALIVYLVFWGVLHDK